MLEAVVVPMPSRPVSFIRRATARSTRCRPAAIDDRARVMDDLFDPPDTDHREHPAQRREVHGSRAAASSPRWRERHAMTSVLRSRRTRRDGISSELAPRSLRPRSRHRASSIERDWSRHRPRTRPPTRRHAWWSAVAVRRGPGAELEVRLPLPLTRAGSPAGPGIERPATSDG